MADDDATLKAVRLPPNDALAYFRGKENVSTAHWTDLWHEGHVRGFMVAGAAADALLKDLRAAVDKAIKGDIVFKTFQKEFEAIAERHGWKYNGQPGWRARIIYDTNMATAYSAGRYRRMSTPVAREMFAYWRYRHHACPHPRVQHMAWDGMILRNDDPWWNTHFPPNGWRCHCDVEVVSESMLERNGWVVSDSPKIETTPWVNPHTGQVHQVPVGIDPGFGYNPGKAWEDNEAARVGRPAPLLVPEGIIKPPQNADHPMAPQPEDARPDLARPMPLTPEQRRVSQRNAIDAFMRMPIGHAEVGTVPENVRQVLGAATPHVRLSEDTLIKQNSRHPEITAEEYGKLPDILAAPHIVAQDGDRRVVFFRRNGRDYRAALKTTQDGSETYLVSFHRTEAAAMRRALKRMTILDGSVEDLLATDVAAKTESDEGDD